MSLRYRFFHYLAHKQVLFALFLIALSWFVFQIRDLLVIFFLSYIITAALLPLVAFLHQYKVPKFLAIVITYFGALIFIFALLFPLVSFIPSEIGRLFVHFPEYLDKSASLLGFKIDLSTLRSSFASDFSSIGQNAFEVTTRVFGSVFSLVSILIVSFYLLWYHEQFKQWVGNLFGEHYEKQVEEVIDQIDEKLGAWLRGQLILSICIGFSIYLALTFLGMPFALPLGLLAGMLELLPTLGPTLAAIPSIIVALTISPNLAIIVILVYIAVQFVESHVLVPNIMQKAVGLNPVMVILGIGVGARLMGIAGALLAVPFISFLIVLFSGIKGVLKSHHA